MTDRDRSPTKTRAQRLALLRELAPRASLASLSAILDQDERLPKKRGPRPISHAKARQIARLWDAYRAGHAGKSVAALAAKFLTTLPVHLRPKGRGTATSKTLSNVIGRGQALNHQRPALRRLVSVLEECDRLAASGSRPTSAARAAIRAGRAGRRGDLAHIDRVTRENEFLRDSATRALLGGDAYSALSFIRPPQK